MTFGKSAVQCHALLNQVQHYSLGQGPHQSMSKPWHKAPESRHESGKRLSKLSI